MWLTIAPFLALEMKSHYTYFGPFIQQSGGLRCTEERVSDLQLPVAQPLSLNLIFRLLRAAFSVKLRHLSFKCTFTLKTETEKYAEILQQFQHTTWPHNEHPSDIQ